MNRQKCIRSFTIIKNITCPVLILIILILCMNKVNAQCPAPVAVTCPALLITSCAQTCNNVNPPIIRNNLGWGINYNCATDTYNYIEGASGEARSVPSSQGLIRTIYARVVNPNRGPRFLYFSKKYFYNISIAGRNKEYNLAINSNFNNSCWLFDPLRQSSLSGLWTQQQNAFRRGQVTGLDWKSGVPNTTNRCPTDHDLSVLKSSVADRAVWNMWMQPGPDIPILPRANPVRYQPGIFRPCRLISTLCIRYTGAIPTTGTLLAFTADGNSRIIAAGVVIPATGIVAIPYNIQDDEYLQFTEVGAGPWNRMIFNEVPSRLGSAKAIAQADPSFNRSPDNICLIADVDNNDIWDDFPIAGIDY